VGHQHDGLAPPAQLAQRPEQPLDLDRRQHRGRLVEDQHLGAARELAHDLRALAHRDRQRVDHRARIDREPDVAPDRRELRRRRRELEQPAALAPEHRVLDDAQAADQRAVLLHHADAALARPRRRVARELDRRAADRELAGVGAHQPEHDLEQGRFSGPVLADDRVDRPALDRQRRARERDPRPEPLVGDDPDRLATARITPAPVTTLAAHLLGTSIAPATI
jgi:hypothetical protein